jgi:hypothetical protein
MTRPFAIATGVAATLGGAMRIAAIFTTHAFAARTLSYFYCAIDVFLMLGLTGWYVSRAGKLGGAGLAGFVVAAAAILTIRSTNLFGAQTYVLGSALLLVGLGIMNLPTLLRRDGSIVAPALWLASLACGIAAAALASMAALAALLFGLGFVIAGVEILRRHEYAQGAQSAQTAISTVTWLRSA